MRREVVIARRHLRMLGHDSVIVSDEEAGGLKLGNDKWLDLIKLSIDSSH